MLSVIHFNELNLYNELRAMEYSFTQDIWRTAIVAVQTQFNYSSGFPNM